MANWHLVFTDMENRPLNIHIIHFRCTLDASSNNKSRVHIWKGRGVDFQIHTHTMQMDFNNKNIKYLPKNVLYVLKTRALTSSFEGHVCETDSTQLIRIACTEPSEAEVPWLLRNIFKTYRSRGVTFWASK